MAKTEAAVETNVFAVARLFSEEVEEKKAIFFELMNEVIKGEILGMELEADVRCVY